MVVIFMNFDRKLVKYDRQRYFWDYSNYRHSWLDSYLVFFNGIVKVIRTFKGLDDDGYDRNKRITNKEIVSDKEDDE